MKNHRKDSPSIHLKSILENLCLKEHAVRLIIVTICLLPFSIYVFFGWGRFDSIVILATFFSAFFASTRTQNKVDPILFALLAIGLSPWKILTSLALLPCIMSLNSPTTPKVARFLTGSITVGLLGGFIWLWDMLALTLGFGKTNLISPNVVENSFNLFSVFGLNLLSAESQKFHIFVFVAGIAALLFFVRSKDFVQKGACISLAASLFLPGQALAASGSALGLIAVGALKNKVWARMSAVLGLTLFAEVYLVHRWDQHAKQFYKDWLYDPSREVSPAVIAFFVIKILLLVKIWRKGPEHPTDCESKSSNQSHGDWGQWPKKFVAAIKVQSVSQMTKSDVVKIFALLAVSVVLTGYNLGSLSKPVTSISGDLAWRIDLAHDQKISDVWIYKSRNNIKLNVICDQDDITQTVTYTEMEAYAWSYRKLIVPCHEGARFQASLSTSTRLYEIYFADGQGNRIQPTAICADAPGSECSETEATRLFDEREKVTGIPTQIQSSYYDEGFHIEDGVRAAGESVGTTNTNPAHPFFGRAMIALSMKNIGVVPFAWRLPDAIAGAMLPLLVLILTWRMFDQKNIAYFAAFLVLCDTSRLTLSRVATTDSQLCFWVLVQSIGLWEWLRSCAQPFAKSRSIFHNVKWLVVLGIGLGFASGIKWSGAFTLPVLGVVIALGVFVRPKPIRTFLNTAIILAGTSTIAYGIGYAAIIDKWDFSLIEVIASDIFRMLRFHQTFSGFVPYQSQFVEWPWLNRPVALFAGYGLPPEKTLKLFIVGNPFVYWAILPAIYLAFIIGSTKKVSGNLFAVGFFLSLFAVWAFVGRLTFLYHFAPIMPFGAIIIASVLHNPDIPSWVRKSYLTLVGIGFVVFVPLALGLAVPKEILEISNWFTEWFGLFDYHNRFLLMPPT